MNKSRLIIASLTIASATLVASFATTLAWYERSNRLQVSNINITFKGEKDLLIGLNENDLKEEINDFEDNQDYLPVSSMYSTSWLNEKSDTPLFRKAYRYVNSNEETTYKESTVATSGYFQHEFYLYSNSNVYVSLAADSLFQTNETKNLARANSLYGNNLEKRDEYLAKLNNSIKSLRISILVPEIENYSYTIIDPLKSEETYLCGKLDIDRDGYYEYGKVDGSTKEIVFGEYQNEDKIVYDIYQDADSDVKDPSKSITAFNSRTKRNVERFNLEKSIENGFVPVKEDSISLEDTHSKLMIPLDAHVAKRIVMSIYLEGWDTDNVDEVINGAFSANIAFDIVRDRVVNV